MNTGFLRVAVGAIALLAAGHAAAEPFSRALTPADYAAAGLHKLTPAERERLDGLVREFKEGVRSSAPAIGRSVAPAEAGDPEPGVRARASVVVAPGTRVEYSLIESRLAGEFRGWEARTVLVLENGQRWQVVGGDSYVTPPVAGPAVKIAPGALGSFWMTIEGVRPRVKVVRVDATR